jgi:hypothetical protein
MSILTETAIVPFQGKIQPTSAVNRRTGDYTAIRRYQRNEEVVQDYSYDEEVGGTYGKLGEESKLTYSLGKNIDIYV